jgi:hypothetical protein
MAMSSRFRDALLLTFGLWIGLSVSLLAIPVPLPVGDVGLVAGNGVLSLLIGFGVLYIGEDDIER